MPTDRTQLKRSGQALVRGSSRRASFSEGIPPRSSGRGGEEGVLAAANTKSRRVQSDQNGVDGGHWSVLIRLGCIRMQ